MNQEAGGKHYGQGLQPWDLQKCMVTSGNAFVDARRADAIKYSFRIKGDSDKQLDDLKKARHCLDEAIKFIEHKNTISVNELHRYSKDTTPEENTLKGFGFSIDLTNIDPYQND